jgi:hypothetical protein
MRRFCAPAGQASEDCAAIHHLVRWKQGSILPPCSKVQVSALLVLYLRRVSRILNLLKEYAEPKET